MRPLPLLTIPLFLTLALCSIPAVTQEPVQNTLPNPADFVPTSPQCKRKVGVTPWVGTPAAGSSGAFHCVLTINTCDGPKTYKSAPRSSGPTMCADYWRVHDELVNREICCERKEKTTAQERPPAKSKCEPAAQWFDSSDCKELENPQLVIEGDKATLSMCGVTIHEYVDSSLRDKLFADAYKAALRDQLEVSSSSKVCCEKFRDAVKTGKPCNPAADLDCDGTPNTKDLNANKLPEIDAFIRSPNARIDAFPANFDSSNPDFMPNRTARESKDVGDCPCKWELVGGDLKCSTDGKERHHYKATWRCPQNGKEVMTVRYAPPTARCEK
jgi:hypothetical protein